MTVMCGLCGRDMPSRAVTKRVPAKTNDRFLDLARGVCTPCAEEHLGPMLDRLDVPVLAITDQMDVVFANNSALRRIGKAARAVKGERPGDALSCSNARLPGGCGYTPHCKTCIIRNSAVKTWKTGRSRQNIPTTFTRLVGDRTERVSVLVSTVKVNNVVLLRIETPRSALDPCSDRRLVTS